MVAVVKGVERRALVEEAMAEDKEELVEGGIGDGGSGGGDGGRW